MSNQEMKELHVCRGMNSAAGQGLDGSGTMAGNGSCATAVYHGCAGSNDCKGQGGCGEGSAKTQEHPGENHCKGQGGCAVPITDNVSSAGSNIGQPVWDLARALFEKRMKAKGIAVADAPDA